MTGGGFSQSAAKEHWREDVQENRTISASKLYCWCFSDGLSLGIQSSFSTSPFQPCPSISTLVTWSPLTIELVKNSRTRGLKRSWQDLEMLLSCAKILWCWCNSPHTSRAPKGRERDASLALFPQHKQWEGAHVQKFRKQNNPQT